VICMVQGVYVCVWYRGCMCDMYGTGGVCVPCMVQGVKMCDVYGTGGVYV